MMPIDPIRITEHVHGHLGWLAAIALLHPAILLRRPKRRAHLAVSLAVAVATAAGALGVSLYEPYREKLKQAIFIHAPTVGFLFERKEHLAFGTIVIAWLGAVAYGASWRTEDPMRATLHRLAFRAFAIAAAMALATATLGTIVAAYKMF
jgi:hypothetical protein